MSDGKKSSLKNVYRRWFYRYLAKKYMKGCVVLDVGSGNGFFAKTISDVVAAVIRIDKNPVDDETRGMSYEQWTEPVDVVWASQFIEHVNALDFAKWLGVVCKKYAFIITPRPTEDFWDDPDHIRPYTRAAVRALLEKEGFTILKSVELWPTHSHMTIGRR